MKLYNFEHSGNCHKIRMMLSFLEITYEKIDINLLNKDQLDPDFIRLNPLHKVPVLDDDGYILRDSAAILIYLARKYGKTEWYPDNAESMAEIQQWLSFSLIEMFNGLAITRAIVIFKRDMDPVGPRAIAMEVLDVLERHLKDHDWLALGRITIADISCYPYTALIHEGGISLQDYPSIRAWLKRVEKIPNAPPMRGLPYPA